METEKQNVQNSDVAILIGDRDTKDDDSLDSFLVKSTESFGAEKANMGQWCNDIRESGTFRLGVFLIMAVVAFFVIICGILFGEEIFNSLHS